MLLSNDANKSYLENSKALQKNAMIGCYLVNAMK